jgi:hypothetical protein
LDGWNRLEISEVGMTFLLQTLSVFPQFFKHLSTFGIKDFPRDEGFAGYDLNLKHGLDTSLSSIGECDLNPRWSMNPSPQLSLTYRPLQKLVSRGSM